MLFQLVVLLISCAILVQSSSPAKSISTSQQVLDSLDGVELNFKFPFKVGNYFLGFKHSLGLFPKENKIIPGPDTLFAKRTFKTGVGSVAVDTSLETKSNVFKVTTDWFFKKTGATVHLGGDSIKKLNAVGVSGAHDFHGNKVDVNLVYHVHEKSTEVDGSVWKGDNVVKFHYDTASHVPKVSVTHHSHGNALKPSVNLKTGAVDLSWNQNWKGGSLESILAIPDPKSALSLNDKKLTLNWKDGGSHGTWLTKAIIPLSDVKHTKVTLSRDWTI